MDDGQNNGAHCQRCGVPCLGNLCAQCIDQLLRTESIKRKIRSKYRRLVWDITQAVLALAAAGALVAYALWEISKS